MSTIPSQTPSAIDAAPLSEGARIVNTFVAPSKTFTDLRRSAAWWAPFLLMTLVSLAFAYTVDKKIGFEKVAENNLQMSPKMADRVEHLPPPDRDRDRTGRVNGARYITYSFPILLLIINLLFAAILFASFKFGASADVKFSKSLAVMMYAGLPGLFKLILAIASILAGANPDSFFSQNPVATNPGYFLVPSEGPGLYTFASQLDVFTIWTLILVAVGFSCIGKVKRGTAYVVVFGWFVVWTGLWTALAAMFS